MPSEQSTGDTEYEYWCSNCGNTVKEKEETEYHCDRCGFLGWQIRPLQSGKDQSEEGGR